MERVVLSRGHALQELIYIKHYRHIIVSESENISIDTLRI